VVEHFLGREEVVSSILTNGSKDSLCEKCSMLQINFKDFKIE